MAARLPLGREEKRREEKLNVNSWEGRKGARRKKAGEGMVEEREKAGVNLRLIKSCRIGRRGELAPLHFVILAAKCPDAGADCLAALY